MKVFRIAILSVFSLGVLMPVAGCQKNKNTAPAAPVVSDTRQTRLTADENHRLKSQMQQLDAQVAKLTKDLQQCTEEKAKSEEEAGKNVAFVFEESKKETADLKSENVQLKAQIQKLENDLNQLKGKAEIKNP